MLNRCAIVITVQRLNVLRIVSWITWSVFQSTFAVASSITILLSFFNEVRAKHSSCHSLTLKFAPHSQISLCNCRGNISTMFFKFAFSNVFQRSLLSCSSKGSKFMRNELVNRTGFCVITDIARRDLWRSTVLIFIPSVITWPVTNWFDQ